MLATIGLAVLPILLVFIQPDIGSALVYVAALGAVLFVAGTRWSHLVVIWTVVAVSVTSVLWLLPAAGVNVLKPYQQKRITGFLHPGQDPQGSTYNQTQSITAVGSGGTNGRGVKGATQTNLNYLPEHATDFAFASLAEQQGFLGAGFLLMLYLLVVWRGLKVVTVARDAFSAIAAAGIVFAFLFQVFVNVGMTIGIAPVTGIPCRWSASAARRWSPTCSRSACSRRSTRAAAAAAGWGAGSAEDFALPVKPGAVLGILKELRASAKRDEPLVVSGANELAGVLRRELARGGVGTAVREQGPLEGAAALVHVLAGPVDADDEQMLKEAARARIPIVAVVTGPAEPAHVPYVLDENVVRVGSGTGFPVEEIGSAAGRGLGEAGNAAGRQATGAATRGLRGADPQVLAAERDRRRGRLRPRRRPARADAEPGAARAPHRRRLRLRDRQGAPARGARRGRLRAGLPGGRPAGDRRSAGRRLGDQGRGRLRRNARAGRGGDALLRAPCTRDAGRRRPHAVPALTGSVRVPGPSIAAVRRTGRCPMVTNKHEAEELLMIEEADAWFEYLEATRTITG